MLLLFDHITNKCDGARVCAERTPRRSCVHKYILDDMRVICFGRLTCEHVVRCVHNGKFAGTNASGVNLYNGCDARGRRRRSFGHRVCMFYVRTPACARTNIRIYIAYSRVAFSCAQHAGPRHKSIDCIRRGYIGWQRQRQRRGDGMFLCGMISEFRRKGVCACVCVRNIFAKWMARTHANAHFIFAHTHTYTSARTHTHVHVHARAQKGVAMLITICISHVRAGLIFQAKCARLVRLMGHTQLANRAHDDLEIFI